jgi:hypothetical protein
MSATGDQETFDGGYYKIKQRNGQKTACGDDEHKNPPLGNCSDFYTFK